MSVELRPMGVHCNIACQYCYQNPIREAGNVVPRYDMEKMKTAIVQEGGPFTLFGGEPLLMPMADLETLFTWGLETFGRNTVQTNGTLITPAHIDMFARLKVHVGVSVDGPGALNDVRWVSTLDNTRAASDKTHRAIADLCAAGMPPSIIITLHRINGVAEAFEAMNDWICDLEAMGVRTVRLHVLEVDHDAVGQAYQLSHAEQVACFANFRALERDRLTALRFDIFDEVRKQLVADDIQTGCVWHACDPLTTKAVRGVEGQGQRSNCGRTNKDGIEYIKAPAEGFERYIALYATPYADGGCQGCRFFLACKGQCPGTAEDGDWRNRSEACGLWTAMFEEAEQEVAATGTVPLSRDPRRTEIEHALIEHWKAGQNPALQHLLTEAEAGRLRSDDPAPWRFARMSWATAAAERVWAPRLIALRHALIQMRRLAVAHGLYDQGIEVVPIQHYGTVCVALEDAGLKVHQTEVTVGARREIDLEATGGALAMHVIARYGRIADVQETPVFMSDANWLDHMAFAATPDSPEIDQHWTVNPFWTLLGLDLLPAAGAVPDAARQEALVALGRAHGFDTELGWLSEVLSWPVEWSVLHGIGQIQTPVMRLLHDIAYTPDKRSLRWAGQLLPLEAAQSHGYAFRQPKRRRVTTSTSFLRGIAQNSGPVA